MNDIADRDADSEASPSFLFNDFRSRTFRASEQLIGQAVVPTGAPGEQIFLQNTCVNCHAIRGLPAVARVGPDLTHVGSRATLATGVIGNTPANLQRWIRNAASIKPGVQRVPTNEIMMVNPTIRDLIIKGEDKKLPDAIRIGFLEGMLDFTESLLRLVNDGLIDRATALEVAPNPEQLKMAFKGIKVATPGIL